MADQRPIIPPPEKMIREHPHPDHTVSLYTELVSRESQRFQELSPIPRGTLYSSGTGADQRVVDQFASKPLYFLKETVPYGGSTVNTMKGDEWVIWTWGTDRLADNAASGEITYPYANVSFPLYTRLTAVRRDAYEAAPTAAYGTALTALIAIKVTGGGTGYLATDTVNIAGSGGATASLVVDANGVITNVVITKEGSGYDSASLPAITVTSATGSGATLVAVVQPKTALLAAQKKEELPADDPYAHEFVQISRVYQTIPGPSLPGQQTGEWGIETTSKQDVLASGATADSGILVKTSKVEPRDSYAAEKLTTNFPANLLDLVLKGTEYDNRFGVLVQMEKSYVAAGTLGSEGTLSVTEIQPQDIYRSIRIVGKVTELPDTQTWYGTRNHSFPDTLTAFSLIGTEEIGYTYQILDGYSGPCKARLTREFSEGPPVDQPAPTFFFPQSFNKFLEYTASRSGTRQAISTSTSEGARTHSSQSSGTHSGTSTDSGSGTSNSTNSGTHQSSEQSTTIENANNSKSSSSSGSATVSASTSSSGSSTDSGGDSQRSVDIYSTPEGGQTSRTHIYEDADFASYVNTGSNQTHNNSGNETSTHTGTSNTASSGSRSGTSTGNGTSTSNNTSQTTHTGQSSGTSQNTSAGTSNSSGTESGTSSSSDVSTGITHVQVSIPRSLHAAFESTLLGSTVSIPATNPVVLPYGEWITVDRQSEHWRFGIWVTETIEILVPTP